MCIVSKHYINKWIKHAYIYGNTLKYTKISMKQKAVRFGTISKSSVELFLCSGDLNAVFVPSISKKGP